MSDSKKDSLNKKINLKNKKEATKVLNKKKNTVTKAKKATSSKNKTKPVKKVVETSSKKIEKDSKKVVDLKKKKPKKIEKKEEKTKLVLPKEWQVQPTKKKKNKPAKEEPDNLSSKLKSKIFEEVSEQELKAEKIKNKEKIKKNLVKFALVLVALLIVVFVVIKYNDSLKKQLKIYDEYLTGEKITLKDNSIWYVIEDSNNSNSKVKLLKETQIDVNNDGKFDAKDKKKYNSSNVANYDINDKDSAAYYLETEYKPYLIEKIGTIENISILTSKEFVKARGKMGYGYEWQDGNWLANSNLGTWWIDSAQNEKVYAVTKIGSYKLYNANELNYIRPVITIEKELIEKKTRQN